jgi:hypothetical protein
MINSNLCGLLSLLVVVVVVVVVILNQNMQLASCKARKVQQLLQ